MYGRKRVYKKIQVIGVAQGSVENAIQAAVAKAHETLDGISWFEVKEVRGHVADDGTIDEYQTMLEISFEVK